MMAQHQGVRAGFQVTYITTAQRQPFCGGGPAGFQEGLSLTIHDEITRYCKYAYGCSEMLFNPVRQWPRKGPISSLFLTYICLRTIPWYTKVGFAPSPA